MIMHRTAASFGKNQRQRFRSAGPLTIWALGLRRA